MRHQNQKAGLQAMGKGKLAIAASLVIAALVAFGVIDKKTAESILSVTNPQVTEVQAPPPKAAPTKAADTAGKKPPTTRVDDSTPPEIHGWSRTQPQINLTHVFSGEINRSGKPTGYHSRPDGIDPETARVDRIKGRANREGVYTAQVEVYDQQEKRWKSKFSTMFPDSMSHQQVIERIIYAYKNRRGDNKTPWRGPSGKGFQIEGYLSRRGGINTAYPIYVRN